MYRFATARIKFAARRHVERSKTGRDLFQRAHSTGRLEHMLDVNTIPLTVNTEIDKVHTQPTLNDYIIAASSRATQNTTACYER